MMISDSSSWYIGLRKVTDDMKSKNRTDMKSKNRTDSTGIVAAEGTHNAPSFSSTKAPDKLEFQMGRK
jgi:adenylyl cyclase-associated protein